MLASLDDLSPEEQIALTYCAPKGIPLSVFLGRVVGHGEPQWTARDARAAILWEISQAARCSGCGQLRAESMRPEAERPEYEVKIDRCGACELRDAKMAEFQDGPEGGSSSGLYLSVARKAG